MMDKKNIYKLWIEKKSQVEISESFPDKVMNRIYQYQQQPRWFDMQRLIDFIYAHTLLKGGLVAIGALIGLVRIIYMISTILGKGVIDG
jgi:hypothetical protein